MLPLLRSIPPEPMTPTPAASTAHCLNYLFRNGLNRQPVSICMITRQAHSLLLQHTIVSSPLVPPARKDLFEYEQPPKPRQGRVTDLMMKMMAAEAAGKSGFIISKRKKKRRILSPLGGCGDAGPCLPTWTHGRPKATARNIATQLLVSRSKRLKW